MKVAGEQARHADRHRMEGEDTRGLCEREGRAGWTSVGFLGSMETQPALERNAQVSLAGKAGRPEVRGCPGPRSPEQCCAHRARCCLFGVCCDHGTSELR